jgi:hypothetical protein
LNISKINHQKACLLAEKAYLVVENLQIIEQNDRQNPKGASDDHL